MLRISLVSSLLVFSSILTAADRFPLLNIFGPDDRQDVTTRDTYPFQAIGHLDDDCTGTLVGNKLILTAAHCVVDNATGEVREDVDSFQINYANGVSNEKASIEKIWVGTHNPEDFRDRDWAIVKLKKPVKAGMRPLAVEAVDFEKAGLPYKVELAGYSMDRTGLSVHHGCSILKTGKAGTKEDRPVFFDDCDAYAGISGAPLFVYHGSDAVVVGLAVSEFRSSGKVSVHRDEYSDAYANVAIPVTAAAKALELLLPTEDKDLAAPAIDGVYALVPHGALAKTCKAYNGGQAAGGVAYNPALSVHDKSIVDWTMLEKYAKDNSAPNATTYDDRGVQKLGVERGGLPWGFTQPQCMQTLRTQKNGVICGAGLAYSVYRVADGKRITGNEYGYSFRDFDECQRAVQYSTPRLVCGLNGALWYSAFRIAAGTVENSWRTLDECLTYLAQHP